MRIEVDIDRQVLEDAADKAVVSYLSTGKGAELIDKKLKAALNEIVTERRIRSAIQERISRVITEVNVSDKLDEFSETDFENRIAQIFMHILGDTDFFRKAIRDEIKRTIKIG